MTGFDGIDAKLKRLANAQRRQVQVRALRAGGEVIAEEARALVPVRYGVLRDSIGVSRIKRGQNFSSGSGSLGKGIEVWVGPQQGRDRLADGYYGHMIEWGTFRSAAHPFMTPAYEAKRDEAMDRIRDVLTAEVRAAIA